MSESPSAIGISLNLNQAEKLISPTTALGVHSRPIAVGTAAVAHEMNKTDSSWEMNVNYGGLPFMSQHSVFLLEQNY